MNRLSIIYEIFIFFLILFYLTVIIVSYSGSEILTQQQIKWIDYGFIFFFLIEYLVRLYLAPKKWTFVKENIFDLIAIIPFDSWFRVARLMRFIRLLRIVKVSKTIQGIFKSGGLNYVIAFTAIIMAWGSTSIYILEKGINPAINSFMDSVWWTIVTVTTVGYGDISPVTTGGRSIAGILMLVGIGLIGSITGSMAMYFSNLNQTIEGKNNYLDSKDDLMIYIDNQMMKIDQLNEDELEHLLSSIRILYKRKSMSNESIDDPL